MTDPLFYQSFDDPHLQTYFRNKNVRKHLRNIGLINRYGQMISYKEYENNINKRSREKQIKSLLSNEIIQRVIQLEKVRQSNIRNEIEFDAKRNLVQSIKESRFKSKQINSNDFHLLNRPKTSFNPILQQQNQIIDPFKQNPSRLSSSRPSRLSSSRPSRLSSSEKSSSSAKTNTNISHKTNNKDICRITMIYLGRHNSISNANQSTRYDIEIMQQHCGGENLIVYKNKLKPNETFEFESRRHKCYPFALSLYVNGLIDSRISVCCEYKHKLAVPLGGKSASFAILNVQGGYPCQTCRFNQYLSNCTTNNSKSSDQSSRRTETSQRSGQSNRNILFHTTIRYDQNQNCSTSRNKNDDYVEAEELYESIMKKLENTNSENWEDVGYYQCQLGNICKQGLIDYDQSLDHYLKSVEISCQHLSPFDIKLRNIYLSIGHILLLQGNHFNSLAIEYFQRILDIDSQSNHIHNLINDHNYLALLYKNEEDYRKCLEHLNKSLEYISLENCNSSSSSKN